MSWSGLLKHYRSLPSLPARFHIAFGLSSLLTSIVLLAIFTGFVPDRRLSTLENQVSVSEALSSSASLMLERGNLKGIRNNLEFMIERHAELDSVEMIRTNNGSAVVFGETLNVDAVADVSVPIYRSNIQWGELRFHFADKQITSWLDKWRFSPFGLISFISIVSFPAFYFYLGKMLKELNPSAAVPGRVRSALDTIAEALIVIDRKGDIVLANAAFAELNGCEAEELVGLQANSLGWQVQSESDHSLPWVRTLESGEASRNIMIAYENAQGQVRKFLVNCSPVMGNKDRIGGVLISMDDVTLLEEKEMLLRQSMEAAEEANQAKSAFLSNMSHEIRTPMTAILGFTEILRRGLSLSNAEKQKHLGTISRSGEHLLELINDVLDLSKVESGAMDVESIPTKAAEIANDVVKVLGVKANEKQIGLTLEVLSDLPPEITSDPSRLRQILTNLIGNAIKFTEKGGVSLSLSFDPTNDRMSMRVSDTGIGMSAEQQASIFDAFTQADSSITRRFGGTGLGLSISRKLAEALGGCIEVSSVPGEGSQFELQVPTGKVDPTSLLDADAIKSTFDTVEDAANLSWVFPAAQVLVVDDAPENRELLSVVLDDLGLQVTTAENGQLAVDLMAENQFSVVLMDIQMPVMDGYEAVAIIRERGNQVPVVALTANAMKGYERKILDAGFSHYQTKPINLDELTDLLARLLNGERRETPKIDETVDSLSRDSGGVVSLSEDEGPIYSALVAENPRFQTIVERFLEKLPAELQVMDDLLDQRQWAALRDKAHWLKGSGGTVGFDQLYKPAKALEKAANNSDFEKSEQLLAQIMSLSLRLSCLPEEASEVDRQEPAEAYITKNHEALIETDSSDDNRITSTLLEKNPKFYSIVERFISRLAEQVDTLEQAYDRSDWREMAETAHWLKGSCGNVGFDGFTELAVSLEISIDNKDSVNTSNNIDAIKHYTSMVILGWDDSVSVSKSA